MKHLISLFLLLLSGCTYANEPFMVAIIDSGLDLSDPRFAHHLCQNGHEDFTGEGINDVNGHGTHVTGLIIEHANDRSDYCLVILKYYSEKNSDNYLSFTRAVIKAVKMKAKLVNISGGGSGYREFEKFAINKAEAIFVVAAGNDHENLDKNCQYFPACYKLPNIMVVGSLDSKGKPLESSNFGNTVQQWELGENVESTLPNGKRGRMSGTSQATAITTGKLLNESRVDR